MSVFTFDNEAYVDFLRYGGMLMVKLMLMSPITAIFRFVFKSFKSEEDAKFLARDNAERQRYLTRTEPHVERARSAHLNDLENLVPFFIVTPFYLSTNPDPLTAGVLIKVFVAVRFAHTVIYLARIPQPARALSFAVGLGINLYFGFVTIVQGFVQ